MIELANHIGGRARPAASGATLEDRGPATGEVIATLPDSGPADVDAAVAAAQEAFEGSWGRSTPAERADLCDAIAQAIETDLERFAALESLDTGKPIHTARTIDIPRAIANFRFFAGAARHDHTHAHPMPDAINYTVRKPLGVVGLITPWNLPLYLLTWKTAPALAMGNTVVAKPSEMTPLTAAALADVVRDVGGPPGVFNTVHGLGATAGAPLVGHADVAAISFTGGTATGAMVAATAAGSFKKLSLELGGKNATVVFADADLDEAAQGAARAGFTNTGQICLCGSRVLVQRPIYEAFVERFVQAVRAMPQGDPRDPSTRISALISAAHRDKVASYVDLARKEGGTLLTGGGVPELPEELRGGYFLEPTVVDGLAPTCRTSSEEIFGPLVTLHPFDDEDEAIAIANGTRYGLAASVWTQDVRRAHRVAQRLKVGMVWVNTWLKRDLRVPFGGTKDSGVGREGGAYSVAFFTEDQNICIQL